MSAALAFASSFFRATLTLSAAASAGNTCFCPPANLSGVWGGVQINFSAPAWSRQNQGGTFIAQTASSEWADLGVGHGVWSGGYHYFRASINFTNAPDTTFSGQLDCTCDNLIVTGKPKGKRETLNWMKNTTKGPRNWTRPALDPPAWVKNLTTIYELNPRAFTSPAGVGANGTCLVNPANNAKGGCGSGLGGGVGGRAAGGG